MRSTSKALCIRKYEKIYLKKKGNHDLNLSLKTFKQVNFEGPFDTKTWNQYECLKL